MPIQEKKIELDHEKLIPVKYDGQPLPKDQGFYLEYRGLSPDAQAESCFTFVESDPFEHILLKGLPNEAITFSNVRKKYFHSHVRSSHGTLLSQGPARLSLDPRSEKAFLFQSIASGASVLGGTEKSRHFGRSAFREPENDLGISHGWVKYKGVSPFSPNSSPIHLTVPYESVNGGLVDTFIAETRSGSDSPKPVTDHIFNRVGWEMIGGNFAQAAVVEMKNSMRYAEIYRRIFHSFPNIELPIGADIIHGFAINDRLVRAANVLAARAQAFPDEADMLKLQFLYKFARKSLPNTDNPRELMYFMRQNVDIANANSYEEIAKLYLSFDPLVEMKYYSPSFFRNTLAVMMANPKLFKSTLEEFGAAYKHESIDQTLQKMYLGAITDILMMYYPVDSEFVFPQADNFEDLRHKVQAQYKETFDEIASNEVQSMAQFVGIMNMLGIIPIEALDPKDMTLGKVNDMDWGEYGHEDLIIPDASVEHHDPKQVTKQRVMRQFEKVKENIHVISWMLGSNATNLDYTFRLHRLYVISQMRDILPLLNLHPQYLSEAASMRLDMLLLEKSFRSQLAAGSHH